MMTIERDTAAPQDEGRAIAGPALESPTVPGSVGGAEVQQHYVATVKDYLKTDADFLAAARRFPVAKPAWFVSAFDAAEQSASEAWRAIGYNPIGELEREATLAGAVDAEPTCDTVDEWFDLGGLSDITVGECWDAERAPVDCRTPHTSEIFLQVEHPAEIGAPYPGSKVLDSYSRDQCLGAFEPYVGRAFDASSLSFVFLNPARSTWDANDREIVCALVSADRTDLTAAMRGSGS